MGKGMSPAAHVIAMHGWAGDARCWRPWIEATKDHGWQWQCGERGYGELTPSAPAWPALLPEKSLRVVIGHSLGPHLIASEVLQQADAVVMLASFAAFIPPGREGRRVRAALDGMAAKLENEEEAREMLEAFLANAAAPQSVDLLPPGLLEGDICADRLRDDLQLLRACEGLPRGFPSRAKVLVIEAGEDRIVTPGARRLLRQALPGADTLALEGIGHALLHPGLIRMVKERVMSLF